MGTGDGDPIAAIRRRAQATAHRHILYLVLFVVAVVVLLLVVPTQSSSSSSGGNGGGTITLPNLGSGTAASGVVCTSSARQVTWSAYAPPCQGKFTGNNGGATSRGVTGSTITIDYRAASTSQLAELYAIVPPKVIGTNQQEIDTLEAYINVFNKDFELYGRKVVLKTFQGKGDFVSEDLGEDQAQAQEDAVTAATSLDTFADTSLIDSSAVYSTDLEAQKVVTLSLYENAQSWYQLYAPYEYTPGPNCTKAAVATAAILGKQLGHEPAALASGDGANGQPLDKQTRTFGIIYPQNNQSDVCAQEDASDLAKYGIHLAIPPVGVKFDLSSLIDQSNAAVAQMKAAGVTTVILSSADPITPRFLMDAADNDNYHPEWWLQSYFSGGQTDTDALARLFPADQRPQMFGTGNQAQPVQDQEAMVAYKLGAPDPSVQPIPSFVYTYNTMLQFFTALQLAGPDLTPHTFYEAMSKIPQSEPWGMFSGWNGAQGPYDPSSGYRVVRWDPNATSGYDGKKGAWVGCDGYKEFLYANDGSDAPSNQQLSCSPSEGAGNTPPASALHPSG